MTDVAEKATWPDPPVYAFDSPRNVCTVTGEDVSNSASATASSSNRRLPDQQFWREAVWSPDGTHLLAQSDDHHLDLFRLDGNGTDDETEVAVTLHHTLSTRAPTTLLAFAWYPFARQDEPATWCFAMSARDVPLRLVDAYQGKTRATYGIFDHVERFVGPQAIAFSPDGQHLYCAHDASISTFALARPGVNTYDTVMRLTPSHRATRKGKAAAGQRGSIACLAVSSAGDMLAVGTFAGTMGVYHTDAKTDRGEDACLMGWKEEPSHGVSQIAFHPAAPHLLFVASRRSNYIRVYDLRYVGSRRSFLHPPSDVALIASFRRASTGSGWLTTQQRLFFHIDWAGRYLAAGDSAGEVRVWNVALTDESVDAEGSKDDDFFGRILRQDQPSERAPSHRWTAARDAIAAVAFHPSSLLLLIASGSRRWRPDATDSDAQSSDDSDASSSQGTFAVRDGVLRLCRIGATSVGNIVAVQSAR